MREWISVKDNLPEVRKSVLAVDRDSKGYPRQFVAWCTENYEWKADGAFHMMRSLHRVSHWMPLPPHPEDITDTD